jgi:hypothetical protein
MQYVEYFNSIYKKKKCRQRFCRQAELYTGYENVQKHVYGIWKLKRQFVEVRIKIEIELWSVERQFAEVMEKIYRKWKGAWKAQIMQHKNTIRKRQLPMKLSI